MTAGAGQTGDTWALSMLELVYPPVSNQEAEWVQQDADVERTLRTSDFYVIGARSEIQFVNPSVTGRGMAWDIALAGDVVDSVEIEVAALDTVVERGAPELDLRWGEKVLYVYDERAPGTAEGLVEWFTTEKLLFDRSRGRPGIHGLGSLRDLMTYDLLYVGIAKKTDTYERLLRYAHQARQSILGNEPQRRAGARVTDEVYLFAFRVETMGVTTLPDLPGHFPDPATSRIDRKAVVADAEKAFVNLLRPQYNSVVFRDYPRGRDGLYHADLRGYGYVLCENLIFDTPLGRFAGGRIAELGFPSADADVIQVRGDDVVVVRGGFDFGPP